MVDVRTTLPDGDIVEQVPPFRQPPQPPRRYSLPLGANPPSTLIRVNPEEASDKGTNRVILTKLAGLLRRRGAGGTPHDRLLDRDAAYWSFGSKAIPLRSARFSIGSRALGDLGIDRHPPIITFGDFTTSHALATTGMFW